MAPSRTPALHRTVLRVLVVALALAAATLSAQAVQPDEMLKDPALEARARGLSAGLRCLVCQNQSIDDSNAPLARDLRLLVRERLKAGDTDRQVMAFIVARYGEFVLLRPPWSARTLLLWLSPALLLLGVVGFVFARMRRQKQRAAAAPSSTLTDEEQRELDALLK